ncbi:MAG: hypothetical protein AAB470_03105 [Patescibacteria group bacterium]
MKYEIQNHKYQKIGKSPLLFISLFIVCSIFLIPFASFAADPITDPITDPTKSGFKLVVCDGPTLPKNYPNPPKDYVPCDFKGVMLQIQHLINVMIVLGVFAAIAGFSWAGFLYISGDPNKIKKAHAVFPKVFLGFIIMLSAWFIVYQILSWLTKNEGFKTLLGNP